MIFKKNILKLYSVLFLIIIISGFLIFISNNIYIHLFAFISLVIGAIVIVKFDISHPYFWYSFVFMLYAISYPILWINGNTYDIYTYTKSLMISQWMALSIVLLMIGPNKTEFEVLKNKSGSALNSKPIMIVLSFVILLTIMKISRGSYTHKSDIYGEGSVLTFIGFRAVLVLLILYTVNLSRTCLLYNRIDKRVSTFVFFGIFLMVYFSGERDLLIRFLVSFIFVYFILIKKRKIDKNIIILGLLSLLSIPILAQYKYYGLTGVKKTSQHNFLLRFISSEFQSASKNLQILLLDESTRGTFKGATIYSSLIRSLKLDKIFNLNIVAGGKWFNSTYFSINRAGQGFTLIGEGYINYGYAGIMIVFIFVGILIKTIYKKSNKSLYHFSFYILSIPVFMYSIRADIANILSPLIVQNLVTIILTHYIMEVLYGGKRKTKINVRANSNNY